MEKSISKGLIYPQTVKIIERNGGEVGPQEIILRNIQQERPYLNTGATMVIFKSGEYVYYNKRGTWNNISPSMSQGITRLVAYACREDESSEAIILRNKGFVLLLSLPYTASDNTKQEASEIPACSPTEISDQPASLVALRCTQCQDKLRAKIGVNTAHRFQCIRGPPGQHGATQPVHNRYQIQEALRHRMEVISVLQTWMTRSMPRPRGPLSTYTTRSTLSPPRSLNISPGVRRILNGLFALDTASSSLIGLSRIRGIVY
jgi:hypothetical protein